MSRHNRKVPTSFFYRFTQDVCAFANKWAQGRMVSVLEGGYSFKALLSGAMAHLTGLVDGEEPLRKIPIPITRGRTGGPPKMFRW